MLFLCACFQIKIVAKLKFHRKQIEKKNETKTYVVRITGLEFLLEKQHQSLGR